MFRVSNNFSNVGINEFFNLTRIKGDEIRINSVFKWIIFFLLGHQNYDYYDLLPYFPKVYYILHSDADLTKVK